VNCSPHASVRMALRGSKGVPLAAGNRFERPSLSEPRIARIQGYSITAATGSATAHSHENPCPSPSKCTGRPQAALRRDLALKNERRHASVARNPSDPQRLILETV
jgi:hypothetical protein